MYENLDYNVNINQTHINLKIIRVLVLQPSQNSVTCYQRGNQHKNVEFIRIIIW